MKKFWLELSNLESEEDVRKTLTVAKPDAVVLSKPFSGLSVTVASRLEGGEITVTSDPNRVISAQEKQIPVALEVTIRDRRDQETVSKYLDLNPDYLLVDCPNWKIIPAENLIAEIGGRSKLLVKTRSAEESKTLLSTLEIGVDGICLESHQPDEIRQTYDLIHGQSTQVPLSIAKVTSVKPIGTGARVCVDTSEILQPGEGLLTGASSQGLFLIEGEIHTNDHVNARPFRVNAGPVSLYVYAPDGKTQYLSELSAGEPVLLVDMHGRTRSVDIVRVKIERRPMVLLEASVQSHSVKTVVQNAETVRLVTGAGSKSISDIKPGDEVLVRYEGGGRHFGTRVATEMIIEK